MEKIFLVLGIVIIYIASVWFLYNYIKKAHSKGGRWESVDAEVGDIIIMLCPVANTFGTIVLFFTSPLEKGNQKQIHMVKNFFNIKK